MDSEQLRYRPDIDGLRAIAVIAVVAFHAFPEFVPSGFIGVDIFFVISGFLISKILWQGLQTDSLRLSDFYAHRIRRIFPALIVVFFAAFAWGWFYLLPNEFKSLGKHMLSSSAFVSNFTLWSETGYFDPASETKPLLHLWSLGIEEQFYAIWPLFLILIWRFQLTAIKVTIALITTSFILNIWYAIGLENPSADFYSPLTRAWELFLGGILAFWHAPNNRLIPFSRAALKLTNGLQIWRNWIASMGLILLIVSIVAIPKTVTYPGAWALLPTLATVFLISSGPNTWIATQLLAHPLLVGLGLISYPFYLWHWPLLSFAQIELGQLPNAYIRASAIGLALLLAGLTYITIEKPLRHPKSPQQAYWITCTLIIVMIGVALAAYKTAQDGLPVRYPKIVQELLSFDTNYQYRYIHNPFRSKICDLGLDQFADDYRLCPDDISSGENKILLWGDSHAGHLYVGLKERYGAKRIIQRTAGACAPILTDNTMETTQPNRASVKDRCQIINASTLALINRIKPQTVLLAGSWHLDQLSALQATIAKLKSIGIEHILLVGPVPVWKTSLPKAVFLYVKEHGYDNPPPYQSSGLENTFKAVDEAMAQLAKKEQIDYESPVNLLCTDNGCLTHLGNHGFVPPQWDSAHLTVEGSTFLVGQFKPIQGQESKQKRQLP